MQRVLKTFLKNRIEKRTALLLALPVSQDLGGTGYLTRPHRFGMLWLYSKRLERVFGKGWIIN